MTRISYISVYPQPHANFIFNMGNYGSDDGGGTINFINNTDVSAFNASDNVLWHWSYGDGEESNIFEGPHDYAHSGNFTVTMSVSTESGCSDEISQIVHIPSPYYFYVPNAFTPNGDGINETFKPYGFGFNPEKYEFLIFERTGRLIFQTNNFEQGWNGFDNGKMVPFGTYVYLIRTENMEGDPKEYMGTVTVVQ